MHSMNGRVWRPWIDCRVMAHRDINIIIRDIIIIIIIGPPAQSL